MTIGPDQAHKQGSTSRRYRGISGQPLNRRVVMKAAAGVAAIAAAGGIGVTLPRALAQDDDGSEWTTRARQWEPSDPQPTARVAVQSVDEWQRFSTEFPFFALGASWPIGVGLWPVIEVQLSDDGAAWSETFKLTASNDGGGGPDAAEERLYTPLIHTYGSQYVRFRTVDIDGVRGEVAGLRFTYIDATDGPWEHDIEPEVDTLTTSDIGGADMRIPPQIISRRGWGANETYRFSGSREIWPPEYETVRHIIVHHTATPNTQDIPTAIRSIYYYHAVTQGWGDIGYNYLVDRTGRIYQGRFGGQNVIGGHSYQYAIGSSGISIIGDFQNTPVPNVAVAGLAAITAWVGRDLDPYGRRDFREIRNLPVICAHRDVGQTACPGNFLYNRLPEIRDTVAATLDAGDLESPFPGGLVPGDRVRVQTPAGDRLNVRQSASSTATVIGSLANGATAFVVDGPVQTSTANWYMVDAENGSVSGWVTAEFLLVTPIRPPGSGTAYPFGLNIYAQSSVYVRSSPSLSASVLMTASQGMLGFILAGPQTASGYEWYQVRWQNGTIGWSARNFLLPAPFDENPNGQFEVGDTVEATQQTGLRARPGVAQTVVATIPAGQRLQITQDPVGVNGYIWYGVYNATAGGGWAVESSMRAAGPPPAGKFAIGDRVRVTSTMNLRSSSSTSAAVVAVMPTGTTGTVLGGPTVASGYTWWQVQTNLGTGWAAENWLERASTDPPPPPPTGMFAIGDGVRTTANLNMRSGASTTSGVIAVLPSGTIGTVTGGPQTSGGYTWWQIQTSSGTGWVVQNWLEKTTTQPPPPPPPTGKFAIGDRVRTTANLNMRSGASTTSGIVAVLPSGTTGTVTGGPQTSGGYTWWQIQTSSGTGWVVENWLASDDGTSTPGGRFSIGQTVRVTENLNMRSGASTTSGIVAVLPAGTTGTVTGGPQTGSGYTWWQIQTSRGTGWVVQNWLA